MFDATCTQHDTKDEMKIMNTLHTHTMQRIHTIHVQTHNQCTQWLASLVAMFGTSP